MKRKFVSLLIAVTTIVAILSASTKSQAQLIVTADSTISITQNGGVAKLRIQNLTVSAFYCTFLGPTGNVNFSHTAFTSIGPVVDTVIYIQLITPELPTLTPNTGYDWQGKVLGSASGYSLVKTFVTLNCAHSPIISGANQICLGNSSTLTASTVGGTYRWYNNGIFTGGTAQTFAASLAGNYTVEVTFGGCTATSPSFILTVNALPNVNAGFDQNVCAGTSVTLLGGGATSYAWSNGVLNGVPFTPLATTTYTMTGTDVNGCTNTDQVIVNVNALPNVNAGFDQNVCAGTSVTLLGGGATSYAWSNGVLNGVPFTPLATTTYTMTGTDVNGCTNTDQVIVNVNSLPTASVSPLSTTYCRGSWINLVASGGFTYAWAPSTGLNQITGASVIANPVVTTVYTVTITDLNGCTNTAVSIVNVNQLPNAVVSGISPTCFGVPDTISASVGPGYLYDWSTGNTTQYFVDTPSGTTTYFVTVTDLNGCTKVGSKTIVVNPLPTANITPASASFCVGGSVILNASGGVSYAWSPATGLSSTTDASVTASPATTTTYTVTVTDGNGCTNTAISTVNVNALPTANITPASASFCVGGSVILNASGGVSYAWSPATGLSSTTDASVTASPATTTTYTVTVTDGNGCTNTAISTVNVNALPNVNAGFDQNVCAGTSVTLLGGGATSYAWSNGVLNGVPFTPLATTTYTMTGTDVNGCTNIDSVIITVNPIPNVSVSATSDTLCSGGSTVATATGGNTFSWNPGGFSGATVNVSPTSTTTFTVTGTSGGCSDTATVTIVVNPIPTVSISASNDTICAGDSIILTASGANGYAWNTGDTINSITENPTMNTLYTVVGTTNGCTGTASKIIIVNQIPIVTIAITEDTICVGASTSLTASGASTYLWSNGATTSSIVVDPDSTTTFMVIGSNGICPNTATVTVIVNPIPTTSASATSDTLCSGGSTVATATGGNTFSWNPGGFSGATVNVSPTSTTTFTVTGTSGGCSDTATVTIVVNPIPTVSISASNDTICAGDSIILTASGANGYAWNPGGFSGSIVNLSPTITTTFTVTGTDVNGCTNTDQIIVTVDALPIVNATATSWIICAESSTSLSATGSLTYLWSDGQTGTPINVSPLVTTTYTMTGTNANGCTGTAVVIVIVNPLPTVNTLGTATICEGNSTTLSSTGSLTYLWSDGQTGTPINVSPLVTTTYTMTGTDVNGCTGTSSVTVTVNPEVHVIVGDDQTFCEGSSGGYLSASGADNYSWSPMTGLSNANIANPFCFTDTTTFYTVVGMKGVCSDTAVIMITVAANPDVDTSWYNVDTEMLFIGGNFAGEIKFIRKVGSSIEYTPFTGDEFGAYFSAITLADGDGIYVETNNGCSITFPIHFSTGINEEFANQISFGPNPFSDVLDVNIPNGKYKVSLFNMTGQIVRNMLVTGDFSIQKNELPTGIYFLSILSSEGKSIYSTKVEVQ